MDNSSQNKCPKPFGQGLRPPPHLGYAQIDSAFFEVGLPQVSKFTNQLAILSGGDTRKEHPVYLCVPNIIQEMVAVIDQDGDGDISFNEFVWLMTK